MHRDPTEPGFEPLVQLTTLGDRWQAELLVARLRGDGIVARLTGDSGGPYPVTVGGLARTTVWVPEADLDDATALLEETTMPEPVEPAGLGVSPNPFTSILWWVVAAALLAWILWVRIVRFL